MTNSIERKLHRLADRLPDRVSRPGDQRYAAATAIWAKPVGRAPRAVVHCLRPEDVQWAVRAARDGDIALSVRGGGHDWAGRALCDGIVVDLSGMNDVVVAADRGIATIAGGALAADVVAAIDPFGLAAVTGSIGAVGMAGLTLGGGYGPLIGRFGLALDNLIAAEVVLGDGRIVVADSNDEEELFWALRGGGGNFGVVTAMRHRLHVTPGVWSGMFVYPFAESRAVLERCADIAAAAPESLTVQVVLVAGPDGAPAVLIAPTWSGQPSEGSVQVSPFAELGTLLAGGAQPMSYRVALAMFDPYIVHGLRTFMETCWLPALDGDGIEAMRQAMATAASPGCAIITHEFKGAASRVAVDATAFGLRRDHVLVEILAAHVDSGDKIEEQRHREWARAARHAFDATALPGGYPNLLAGSDTERAAKSYGGNAARLVATKRRYDPDDVFRSAIPLPTIAPMADAA